MLQKDEDRTAYLRVLDRMRMLCSRREYCSSDMYRKISSALEKSCPDVPEDSVSRMAAEAMACLTADRYIDDGRYAAAYVRDKSVIAGWGPLKIRRALALKGLSRETIEEALAAADTEAASGRMEKVLETKFRSLISSRNNSRTKPEAESRSAEFAVRMKMLRFAASRGYGYEEAAPVIERLMSEL